MLPLHAAREALCALAVLARICPHPPANTLGSRLSWSRTGQQLVRDALVGARWHNLWRGRRVDRTHEEHLVGTALVLAFVCSRGKARLAEGLRLGCPSPALFRRRMSGSSCTNQPWPRRLEMVADLGVSWACNGFGTQPLRMGIDVGHGVCSVHRSKVDNRFPTSVFRSRNLTVAVDGVFSVLAGNECG